MRVLHLLSSTGVHGAETMAIELIRQIHRLGVIPYLGLLETRGPTNAEITRRARPYVLDHSVLPCRGQLDIRSIYLLRRYMREHDVHVLHSHGYKADLYALLARLGTRVRLVSTCHNWLGKDLKMRAYAALDKRLLRRFDAVAGVSADVVSELCRYVPSHRVVRIGNGVDPEAFRRLMPSERAKQELGLPAKPLLGFVGRLTREKGVHDVLYAAQALRHERCDFQLLIIGDGEERQALEQQAQALGIASAVTFTGTRADMPLLYSALDVFVLPSYQEGFPMSVLEAMACGVPVIATRVGDVPEIVEQGATGLLVPPGDRSALQAAIAQLLTDAQKRHDLGAAGHRRLCERFTSNAMARRYRALYEEVLNRQGGGPLDQPARDRRDIDHATP